VRLQLIDWRFPLTGWRFQLVNLRELKLIVLIELATLEPTPLAARGPGNRTRTNQDQLGQTQTEQVRDLPAHVRQQRLKGARVETMKKRALHFRHHDELVVALAGR
jgi:hypothetical protein